MTEEVDYLICRNCESPCYVFELDSKQRIVSAFCQVCGGDDAEDFRIPEVDEVEGD